MPNVSFHRVRYSMKKSRFNSIPLQYQYYALEKDLFI